MASYVNQELNYKQGLDFAGVLHPLKPCNLKLAENKGQVENPRTKTVEKSSWACKEMDSKIQDLFSQALINWALGCM